MEPEPLLTIAIPTYNRANSYLPDTLKSALYQSYARLEIIVSDNCSTDSTESLVSSFSDSRITYFKHPANIGASNNFAFCLQKARGKYLLLLHDDDLIDSDFIATCVDAFQCRSDVGIVRTGTRAIDAKGRVLWESPNLAVGLSTPDFFRSWFALRTSLYLCSTLFDTAKLRAIGGFKSKHFHFDDVMAEVQIAAAFGRIDVQDVKASFRYHDNKQGVLRLTSAADVSKWCEDSLMLLELMCTLASKDKELVRYEGSRFFANLCYGRAAIVKSTLQRFLGHLIVFRSFNYRHPPSSIYRFLSTSPISRRIRKITGKI